MKSKSAWTSTVPSLLLYKECKICYPAQGQNSRCWQILQQVLEIHHITYLFFFPQATLTMSTMSCSIPWITLCQPGIEIITKQPLPLCSDQFYQENAQTNWGREKRAVLALQQWDLLAKKWEKSGCFKQRDQVWDHPVGFTSEPKQSRHCLSWEESISNVLLKQTPHSVPDAQEKPLTLTAAGPTPHNRTLISKCSYPRWSYVLFKDKVWPQLLCCIQILKVGRLTPQNSCPLYFPK